MRPTGHRKRSTNDTCTALLLPIRKSAISVYRSMPISLDVPAQLLMTRSAGGAGGLPRLRLTRYRQPWRRRSPFSPPRLPSSPHRHLWSLMVVLGKCARCGQKRCSTGRLQSPGGTLICQAQTHALVFLSRIFFIRDDDGYHAKNALRL